MLTIPEVSRITGKSINTIYRYIRQGKLKCYNVLYHGKNVVRIEKQELERFLNEVIKPDTSNDKTGYNTLNHDITNDISGNDDSYSAKGKDVITPDNINIEEIINTAINKALSEKQNILMKNVEDYSIFKLGAISKENEFLQQRLETVLNDYEHLKEEHMKMLPDLNIVQELRAENELLKEQVKALPGPSELEGKDNVILLLKEEQEALQKQIELLPAKPEKITEILLQNAENIKFLQEELSSTAALADKLKEQAEKDKEEALKAMSQAAEKEKLEIVEAWQKKVEELSHPWWKFW